MIKCRYDPREHRLSRTGVWKENDVVDEMGLIIEAHYEVAIGVVEGGLAACAAAICVEYWVRL